MTPEHLRQHLYQKPFQPFRVHLKDGRSYEIRHPNLALAAEAVLIVGIPAPDDPDPVYSDRQVWVQWDQVDRIEPLSTSAAPAG
jgi:hypothetical protein